jgi:hypothetical protein
MSFIVRVWTDCESQPELRGEVENIWTGEKRFFLSDRSLLTLIGGWRDEGAGF